MIIPGWWGSVWQTNRVSKRKRKWNTVQDGHFKILTEYNNFGKKRKMTNEDDWRSDRYGRTGTIHQKLFGYIRNEDDMRSDSYDETKTKYYRNEDDMRSDSYHESKTFHRRNEDDMRSDSYRESKTKYHRNEDDMRSDSYHESKTKAKVVPKKIHHKDIENPIYSMPISSGK